MIIDDLQQNTSKPSQGAWAIKLILIDQRIILDFRWYPFGDYGKSHLVEILSWRFHIVGGLVIFHDKSNTFVTWTTLGRSQVIYINGIVD